MLSTRACLNIHSRHLHAPLRGIFGPNSGYIARYAPFLWTKSSTKWNAQLTESNFQTRSSDGGYTTTYKIKLYTRHMDWLQQTKIHYNEVLGFYYHLLLSQAELLAFSNQKLMQRLEILSIGEKRKSRHQCGDCHGQEPGKQTAESLRWIIACIAGLLSGDVQTV